MEIYVNCILFFGLSLHIQFGHSIRSDIFLRNLSFDNKLPPPNLLGWFQSKSNAHCGRKCLEKSVCRSYLFNYITKNCTFLYDAIMATTNETDEHGWRHYISQDALNHLNQPTELTTARVTTEETTTTAVTTEETTTSAITTVKETVTTAQGLSCPGDYHMLSDINTCLKFHGITYNQNYADRKSTCQSEGGNLVKVDSGVKQGKLHDYLENTVGVTDTDLRIVIQGQEDPPSGDWTFDDGSSITDTQWYPGQPNDSGDNCIAVRHDSYLWKDISCTRDAAFVCEIM